MNYFCIFVQVVQMEVIRMEEKKKVNSGIDYKNRKYRPSVFIDMDKRESIEKHFKEKGYRSFNEYIITLIYNDMETDEK